MTGPVAKSEKIRDLFNKEQLDPATSKILAVAILCESWVRAMPADPSALTRALLAGHDQATDDHRQAAFLAGKIIPQYQPHFIPAGAKLAADTAYAVREFQHGESLDGGYVNQVLAVMLAELLGDRDLEGCSAISLIGKSPGLGETRFGVVALADTKVRLKEIYTKPIFGGIVGTYEEYEADTLKEARAFLSTKPVSEPHYYIEIRTPDGGVGMDKEGSYEFDVDDRR